MKKNASSKTPSYLRINQMTAQRLSVGLNFRSLRIPVIVIALFWAYISKASAQSPGAALSLEVIHPNNGQILYAGPEAPRYVIPIIGKVTTSGAEVSSVQIEVRVMKGSKLVSQIGGYPEQNGEFRFAVSPNPNATIMSLSPDKKSCETCHGVTRLVGLPAGDSLVEVTAKDKYGHQVSVERNLFVDTSRYIKLEVDTHAIDGDLKVMEGVPIVGKTTFPVEDNPAADEQTRYFKGKTDENGEVVLIVEARNAFPTEYHVYVPEAIVSGAKVSSPEESSIIIPPQARSAVGVNLGVQSQFGQITGTITAGIDIDTDTLQVYAIERFNHHANQARLISNKFAFSDLPVSNYVIGFSRQALAVNGMVSSPVAVNLSEQPHERIMLDLSTSGLAYINGLVQSNNGTPLSFAWVKDDVSGETVRLSPLTGKFLIREPKGGSGAVSVIAPGFWSKKWVVGDEQSAGSEIILSMTQRGDVNIITSKDGGRIYVPASSVAIQESNGLKLSKGWAWGKIGASTYNLYLAQNRIVLDSGSEFAVERLADKSPWLLIRSGSAMVEMIDQNEPVEVASGQMLILQDNPSSPTVAIQYDPAVFDMMHSDEEVPLDFIGQPTISARIHNGLAQIGIGAFQGITLLTYLFVVLSTLGFPLLAFIWWFRKRLQSK